MNTFVRSTLTAMLLPAAALVGCANVGGTDAGAQSNMNAVTLARTVCSSCHGYTGNSESPQFPKLAGQQREYLVAQLTDFKGHARADARGQQFMWGFSHLSRAQIEGLADYFSSQSPMRGTGTPAGDRGEMLFEHGLPSAGVVQCAACHGAKGEGHGQFPRLAGQHADYVYKQLKVFQTTEDRPRGAPMKVVTHNLTDADAKALAQYVATLGQ